MYYRVYYIRDGKVHRHTTEYRSLSAAAKFCKSQLRAVVLERQKKNTLVVAGTCFHHGSGIHTAMLVYPKGAVCHMWTPKEYVAQGLDVPLTMVVL
jgi:hypothetical protein